MCASHWVFEAQRRSESKGCVSQLRGDPFLGAAPALRFDLVSIAAAVCCFGALCSTASGMCCAAHWSTPAEQGLAR
jgi:hypothetical protein